MEIVYLESRLDLIKSISEHLYKEFEIYHNKNEVYNADEYESILHERCKSNNVDQILVIVDKETNDWIACGSLLQRDMEEKEEYMPWIADLYTRPEYRKMGYATMLLNAIIELARAQGYEFLYLWTDHPELYSFYEKQGFMLLEEREYIDNKTIGIFFYSL